MFESAYSITGSVDHTPRAQSIPDVIGTQIALKQRSKVSLYTSSPSLKNPAILLNSLLSNSSDSDDLTPQNPLQASFQARKRNVTRIQIQGPLVTQIIISPTDLKEASKHNISPQGTTPRKKRRRRPSKEKLELQRIKDNLNRSALNRFFSEETREQLPNNNEEIGNFIQQQQKATDWRPVVCRQTQQFLHSNDRSQKSEYKHFKPAITKNKKQSRLNIHKTNDPKPIEVLTSQQQSPQAQQQNNKVLHINEVQFGGKPAKPDNRFASHVVFRDEQQQNQMSRESTKQGNAEPKGVNLMINSCSERQEIKLKHNETAKYLNQSIINTSMSQITSVLMPKMNNTLKKSDSRPAKLSSLNIDASVLGRNPIPISVSRKNSEHQPITIPSARKPDQALDYLTDGSVGTEGQHTQYATRSKKIGADKARRVLNKSAYMKKNSLKNYRSGSQSSTKLIDEYVRQAKHKQQVPKKKRTDMMHKRNSKDVTDTPAESERGTNTNNEDLVHVVQQEMYKTRNIINPSPLLSSQTFQSQKMSLHQPASPIIILNQPPASTDGLQNSPQLRLNSADQPKTSFAQTQDKFQKPENYITEEQVQTSPEYLKQKSRLQTHTRATFGPQNSHIKQPAIVQREHHHVAVITSSSPLMSEDYTLENSQQCQLTSPQIATKKILTPDSVPEQSSVNRSKKGIKRDTIGKKRMKALQDRVQNAIQFKDKRSPLTFVTPAPINHKNHRQQGQNEIQSKRIPEAKAIGTELTSDDQSSNNFGQLWSPKMHDRIFREPNDTVLDANFNEQQALAMTLQASSEQPYMQMQATLSPTIVNVTSEKEQQFHQPVKLRVFDLQGIQESQDDLGAQQRIEEHRVANTSTVTGHSSIYKEDGGQGQGQNKERKMLLKVNDDNLLTHNQSKKTKHLSMNATGGMFNLSNKMYRESKLLSPVTAEANQNDRSANVVMSPGPRQCNTSTISGPGGRWLSSEQIMTVELPDDPHDQSQYDQQFKKQMSVSSQQPKISARGQTDSLKTNTASQVQNFKKPSEQQVVIDDQSNDTKYFTKSRAASIEFQTSSEGGRVQEDATPKILQQQQKMQLLELSSKCFSLSTAHRASQLQHLASPMSETIQGNSISIKQNTLPKTGPILGQQSYHQMKAFIDKVIQKKGTSNPVQRKAQDPSMKKHTGWSKILKGVVKAQTPAASANKRQSMKIFTTTKTEQLQYPPSQKIQQRVGVAEPSQCDLFAGSMMKNPILSVPHVKINQMKARPRDGDKRQSREDMFKSSQLRLKPFHHSLVTQNYELLAQQIRVTEENFIKYSQALNTQQLNNDSMTQLQSNIDLTREDASHLAANAILYKTASVHQKSNMKISSNTNIALRPGLCFSGSASGGGALPFTASGAIPATSSTIATSGTVMAQANLAASMNQIQSLRFSPPLVPPIQSLPGIHMDLLPKTPREPYNDSLYETYMEEVKMPPASTPRAQQSARDQASQLPRQVSSPGVAALLYESSKDSGSECATKTVSPLMTASRQNSLAHVYKQLHPGGTQKQWGLLMRSIKNKKKVRNSDAIVQSSQTTNPISSLFEEGKFNKDLKIDGATSSIQNWRNSQLTREEELMQQPLEQLYQQMQQTQLTHMPQNIQLSIQNQLQIQLPQVKTRAIEVGGMATPGGDCESPLANHAMFPMLSPTTAHGLNVNQRQIGQKRRTGRILRPHAGRFQ